MQGVAQTTAPPDTQLAARDEAGDQAAFAALFERHLQGIFDFALRIVRDRDLARHAVQSTFARARSEASDVDAARLYTLARNSALEGLRQRRHLLGGRRHEREGFDFTQVEAHRLTEPSAVLFDKELVELVWDSAAALGADEYSLLDLQVRRQLGAEELAEHVGIAKDALRTKLARLCNSLEETVASTLLATRGRRGCKRLDAVLSVLEFERVTSEVRRAVQQHVRRCAQCQESKRRFVPACEILGSFAEMVPAPALRERIWAELERDAKERSPGRRRRRIFFWR